MQKTILMLLGMTGLMSTVQAQRPALTLDLSSPQASVSPTLYGLMTEEINHSYDGGLYAELIRNRIFKDNKTIPEGWSLVQENSTVRASIKLIAADETNIPREERSLAINGALSTCLRLTVEQAGGRVGIANEGYWGIPVKPATTYRASFYIKGTGRTEPPRWDWEPKPTGPSLPDIENNTPGPIKISLESKDGKTVYATGSINLEKSIYWKKYELDLVSDAHMAPTKDARLVISTDRIGQYYFNLVSLFPPTYHHRPNGNRQDLMQMLVDMKPAFLRLPGGNFLEGPLITDAFPWKSTLGPLESRPGHKGSWGYRASDGMGLLEFLQWTEDMGAEPVLAVYAGYSLDGDHIDAGPLLQPYVADALDEIAYVTGDTNTYWGAKRAADGHPAPFTLRYVEIGNEDWFDRSHSYDGRFKQFREAIEARYPQLTCISTMPEAAGKPAIVDEHYYRDAWDMWQHASQYDKYDRNGPKIFVGEWATREGAPTTNLNAALGDAAWMTGMERNSDIVIMSCYAPLFVNVNQGTNGSPRAWQWDSDLIGYDALNSFGSPSYYVQKLFSHYLGNKIVPITAANIPVQHRKDNTAPAIFYSATLNDTTGELYLKLVNTTGKKQPVDIRLNGAAPSDSPAIWIVLKGATSTETNSITDPMKIVPVSTTIKSPPPAFTRILEPYSVSILQLQIHRK